MRRSSIFLAAGLALALAPGVAGAKRAPWSSKRVAELAERLVQETQQLGETLRASVEEAEAATEEPKMEVGVGGRTVLTADVAILESRAKTYLRSVENGLGREETRALFGGLEALVGLTANDARMLPDYAKYGPYLAALDKTVKELARFYAEELRVTTPPDPLRERAPSGR